MRKYTVLFLLLVALLVPLVACAGAVPQTREETIQIEGMDETITTTFAQSGKGYSLWIDTDIIVLKPEEEGLGMDIYAPPVPDPALPREMVIYTGGLYDYSFEQAIEDTRQVLLDNYGNAEIMEDANIIDGFTVSGISAADGDTTILNYLIETDELVFHVDIVYPTEADGFAARVIKMLGSFELESVG